MDVGLIKKDTEREIKEPVGKLKDKRVHFWTDVITDPQNIPAVPKKKKQDYRSTVLFDRDSKAFKTAKTLEPAIIIKMEK